LERETAREVGKKSTAPSAYPKTGTTNIPDSTERLKKAFEIKTEEDLIRINRRKYGLTFNQFLTQFRNHPLVTKEMTAEKKAYIKLVQACQNKHEKDEKDELVLDENKASNSIHPFYDLYRLYKYY